MRHKQSSIFNPWFIALFVLSFIHIKVAGQSISDSLNRFDLKNKRTGYWIQYLDSSFAKCDVKKAKYYAYAHYYSGKPKPPYMGRINKKDSIAYHALSPPTSTIDPVLLNGNLNFYSSSKNNIFIQLQEKYRNGLLKEAIEYHFYTGTEASKTYYVYFDSLCSNNPETYLIYLKEQNVLVYKQYLSIRNLKPVSEKRFLVPHRDFKKVDRPILGWHAYYDPQDSLGRNFAELGFSRKYISGARVDTVSTKYKTNPFKYQSLNFSLMASNTSKQFILGQKLTYSYNLYFLKAEAGLINYTDFHSTNLNATFGIGITILGYFNEMLYFMIPLVKNKNIMYPNLSFSIVFN